MLTALPATNITIRFPTRQSEDIQETYQLLELPSEILKHVEGKSQSFPLTIKGRPSDDAVLCTPDSTFLLRTVSISNSLLILRTPPSTHANGVTNANPTINPTLEIRDTSHEVLECVPQAPNLGRIRTVLRDSQWKGIEGGGTGLSSETLTEGVKRTRDGGRKRYTRAQLESVIQASEVELEAGLKDRNVIEVDGRMMMLPSIHLLPLLTLILTLLTLHSTSSSPTHVTSPVAPLRQTLEDDHDVPAAVVDGVLDLFGNTENKTWTCEVIRVVKEVGKGLLDGLKGESVPCEKFINDWKVEAGDWSNLVNLKLLEGEYLLSPPKLNTPTLLTPFPIHNLPLHPATRFADLFLTRSKWQPEDMKPFLKGLTRDGDDKERDKLVVKFVRVVREREGGKEKIWWFPRRSG